MDDPRIKAGDEALDQMLLTLAAGGYLSGSEPSDPRQAATWRR